MDAHVPFIPVALIRMGITTGSVVLFQHANLPAEFAQDGCCCQTADAGTDNDCVILRCKAIGTIAVANA